MGSTLTPNLGLIKPFRDTNTPLDVEELNANSDKLDLAARVLTVNPDYIPPSAELWDGRVVREKGTGKVWVAEKQTNGSFLRRWLQYPWQIRVQRPQDLAIPNDDWKEWGWTDIVTGHSINLLSDSLTGSTPKVPITGWYMITMEAHWPGGTSGVRGIRPLFNHASSTFTTDAEALTAPVSGKGVVTRSVFQAKIGAGSLLSAEYYQNSGATVNIVNSSVIITLIYPDPSAS